MTAKRQAEIDAARVVALKASVLATRLRNDYEDAEYAKRQAWDAFDALCAGAEPKEGAKA